jgi:hypothetical protein
MAAFSVADEWFKRSATESAEITDAYAPAPTAIIARPVHDDGQALADTHSEHNRAQNDLGVEVGRFGHVLCGPLPGGPSVDLSWIAFDGRLTVCEVKSVNGSNDTEQLRLGLGQIIDYLDQLAGHERGVSGLLWMSRRPTAADRWQRPYARYGVILGWPGQEHTTLDQAHTLADPTITGTSLLRVMRLADPHG